MSYRLRPSCLNVTTSTVIVSAWPPLVAHTRLCHLQTPHPAPPPTHPALLVPVGPGTSRFQVCMMVSPSTPASASVFSISVNCGQARRGSLRSAGSGEGKPRGARRGAARRRAQAQGRTHARRVATCCCSCSTVCVWLALTTYGRVRVKVRVRVRVRARVRVRVRVSVRVRVRVRVTLAATATHAE